ncbi:MAG: GAF domain-containing protein [Polyangiales bacterium]
MTQEMHKRTGERLDAVVELSRQASAARPLPIVLEQLCRRIAEAAPAPIVSVYLREREGNDEVLVLRANVGLARGAVDNVRLAMGEGVTGFAAECMQPVSTAAAAGEVPFKAIPGIGEEPYPIYLAVPLVLSGRTAGVLVLQRGAEQEFSDEDVTLASAMAGSVALALVVADARRTDRGTAPATEGRTVRVRGTCVVPGLALAQLEALPTLDVIAADADPAALEGALDAIRADADTWVMRLSSEASPHTVAALAAARLWLDDARFRKQLRRSCTEHGMLRGIRAVTREYALVAHRSGPPSEANAWVRGRAADVAGLCLVASARAAGRTIGKPGQALLIPEAPNLFLALHALHRKAAAVLVASELRDDTPVAEVLRLGGMPTIADIARISDWARPGDTLIVDATQGSVVVHPTAEELARARAVLKNTKRPPADLDPVT